MIDMLIILVKIRLIYKRWEEVEAYLLIQGRGRRRTRSTRKRKSILKVGTGAPAQSTARRSETTRRSRRRTSIGGESRGIRVRSGAARGTRRRGRGNVLFSRKARCHRPIEPSSWTRRKGRRRSP